MDITLTTCFGRYPIGAQLAIAATNQRRVFNSSSLITGKLIHRSWDIFENVNIRTKALTVESEGNLHRNGHLSKLLASFPARR